MQLTGPIFLFLFLPLSLFAVLPFSGKRRAASLLAVSLIWYVLANRQNPWGMAVTGGLVLICYLLTLPRGARRFRLVFCVTLPLLTLVFCRITAEYNLLPRFSYPAGLTFVVLGLVSAAVDLYHRPTSESGRFVPFVGYVLFFPVLTFGPIIRYRHFRHLLSAQRPSFASFARGARLYTLGYLKRVAGAAVLMNTIRAVLVVEKNTLHLPAAAILLLLSGAALLFLIGGVSDMARGVASFYGLILPTDMRLFVHDPSLFVGGMFLSLSAFLTEMIVCPLSGVVGTAGRDPILKTGLSSYRFRLFAGQAAAFWAAILFFRFRWETCLLALPLFLLTVPGRTIGRRTAKPGRILLSCLLLPAFLLFAAGVLLPDPAILFRLFHASAFDTYYLYQLFAALSDVRYLLLLLVVGVAAVIWWRYRGLLWLRLSSNGRTWVLFSETLLLFVAFAAALILIMPRFPMLADQPFPWLYL